MPRTAARGRGAGREEVVNVYNWSDYIGDTTVPTSRRRPGSRSITTSSTRTSCSRRSCSRAAPATTSSCRPRPSSSARSRPACTRSSTSRSCRTSRTWTRTSCSALDARSGQRTCGQLHVGHVGLGYNADMVKKALGTDTIDSWSALFEPKMRRSSPSAALRCSTRRPTSSARCDLQGTRPEQREARGPQGRRRHADGDPALHPVLPFLGVHRRPRRRRDLPRARLERRRAAGPRPRRGRGEAGRPCAT